MLNFTGDCADCAGSSHGALTLNTLPDGALTKADFVGFTYASNLVSFSISSADVVAVTGHINPGDLGHAYIDILQLGGTGWEFIRNADGSWSISSELTNGVGKPAGGRAGGGATFTGGSGDSAGAAASGDSGFALGPVRAVDDFGAGSSLQTSPSVSALVPAPARPASPALKPPRRHPT